ncbi:hypothetical protein CVT24_010895 [Panaeolus cyanescens]|uniref:Uncharacterized protein n=1 Tax=Panaeolus cyanescens TaxID=181874 RepID=A0A409WDV3_9AGAR|nr:hypothetical protein CVT24_010895 [Panaeolus cyanescens]
MKSFSSYILLFALYFTSLFYTTYATNPPDLRSVLRKGEKVYRTVTRGELANEANYVVGQKPPEFFPIAGDFAKYGAFYTFATLQEALEWGMHMSGFYYKKPSDHIKNPAYIHNFYLIELTYDPKDLNPTTKFFAKGGHEYTEFIKSNYPPPGHPGSMSMEWGGEPQPAAADIIEGPMSNSRKEPHIRNPDVPPGLYNHQIAFTSKKAMDCLTVTGKFHSDMLEIRPATPDGPSSCAKVYRTITRGELAYQDRYVVGNKPPPFFPIAGDFAKYGALYTFATLQEALEWGMHTSGFYYKKPSDHIKDPSYIHNFYLVEMRYDPKDLKPTKKFFANGGTEYKNFIKSNYPPAGHPGSFTMEWGGDPQPAVADIIEGPMSNSRKEAHIRNFEVPPGLYNHQVAFTSEKALTCLTVIAKLHSDELGIKPESPDQAASCCNTQ